MTISDADHRPFGNTGLRIPPIVFRGDVLDNAVRVIPDQTKRLICGEWFQRVSRSVFIDVRYDDSRHAGLETLARTLRRLDVPSDDVVVNLGLKYPTEWRGSIGCETIHKEYDNACKSLGEMYSPKLVTVEVRDEQWTAVFAHDDRGKFIKTTQDAIRWIAEEKSTKQIAGVGIRCSDWRIANELSDAATLDFVILVGGYTIVRHPPEVKAFLASLAERQIPVIAAGVFHGGFLVGGASFDGRVVSQDHPASQSLIARRKAFTSLCHGHGVRPAHACIQFALSAPGVVAASLSTPHADRVAENVDSVVNRVPEALWLSMKEEGLLEESYAFLD